MKHFIKKYAILFFFLLIGFQLQAQHGAKILKNYKGESETMIVNIPGFVAKWALKTQDVDKEYKQAMKKVKSLKIFIAEETNQKTQTRMLRDFDKIFKKYDYKSLVQVKSDGNVVNIKFLPATKKNKGELVLLIEGDDDFVAMVIEGKFTEEDVITLAKHVKTNEL